MSCPLNPFYRGTVIGSAQSATDSYTTQDTDKLGQSQPPAASSLTSNSPLARRSHPALPPPILLAAAAAPVAIDSHDAPAVVPTRSPIARSSAQIAPRVVASVLGSNRSIPGSLDSAAVSSTTGFHLQGWSSPAGPDAPGSTDQTTFAAAG